MPDKDNTTPSPTNDQPPETEAPPTPQPDSGPEIPSAPQTPDDSEDLPRPPKLKKSRKGLVIGLVITLALAIGGVAGWYFFLRDEPVQPAQQTEAPATEETTDSSDVPEAENTETFTSSPYRLSFKHPSTWTVTEADDSSILIESQDFTYQTATGETTNGNFRVYIRKGGNPADSEIIAKGVAMKASEKLKYDSPTPVQRAETNLSLFGLDTDDNFAFLLITGNFELKAGDTLGPDFGNEAETVVVGGGYSAPSLEPGMATNPVPAGGFDEKNAYQQALLIIKSLEIT